MGLIGLAHFAKRIFNKNLVVVRLQRNCTIVLVFVLGGTFERELQEFVVQLQEFVVELPQFVVQLQEFVVLKDDKLLELLP